MNWKIKSAIQNTIAKLPSQLSYNLYYSMQRKLGGLKNLNPTDHFIAAVKTWQLIEEQGKDPVDKTFFEVGTGRAPLIPIAYYLMGANQTITVDLNPYVKKEVVLEYLHYIHQNQKQIEQIFGQRLNQDRFKALLQFIDRRKFSLPDLLSLCSIKYLAPSDAGRTQLADQSIDFHTSNNVFEHIDVTNVKRILTEGIRILKSNSLFVHYIDYSDHFSHSDSSISAINFLQYSDTEWKRYADNRYMYMNRLRHDDFVSLFKDQSLQILKEEPIVDQRSIEILKLGSLPIDSRFKDKSPQILAIAGSWIITQKTACKDD
ncbi:MAG: methyltransferase domain-containing protein [Leptonema sp. (in: Bacteria)]|nr:methyltransferase domain-containing protein [Leptonema sp. (in: bacteria)]